MKITDDDMLTHLLGQPGAFTREDETEDRHFYARPRMVQHLDNAARATVSRLIESLVVEKKPRVLDLMASISSHLPVGMRTKELVGLGLNEKELSANKRLDRYVVHDLNAKPQLPFPENSFDIVLNTVSVQYLTNAPAVFADVGRVLKPGGLFLVVSSNRSFPTKAIRVWELMTDQERLCLVRRYFDQAGGFDPTGTFIAMGGPRPVDDKYSHLGLPGDPIYAVFAESKGGRPGRPERRVPDTSVPLPARAELEQRKLRVAATMKCPYCQEGLYKWRITDNPWSSWDHDLCICINDACPYLVRGWREMYDQGNNGVSYRFVYDREKDAFLTIPVPGLNVIKDSVESLYGD